MGLESLIQRFTKQLTTAAISVAIALHTKSALATTQPESPVYIYRGSVAEIERPKDHKSFYIYRGSTENEIKLGQPNPWIIRGTEIYTNHDVGPHVYRGTEGYQLGPTKTTKTEVIPESKQELAAKSTQEPLPKDRISSKNLNQWGLDDLVNIYPDENNSRCSPDIYERVAQHREFYNNRVIKDDKGNLYKGISVLEFERTYHKKNGEEVTTTVRMLRAGSRFISVNAVLENEKLGIQEYAKLEVSYNTKIGKGPELIEFTAGPIDAPAEEKPFTTLKPDQVMTPKQYQDMREAENTTRPYTNHEQAPRQFVALKPTQIMSPLRFKLGAHSTANDRAHAATYQTAGASIATEVTDEQQTNDLLLLSRLAHPKQTSTQLILSTSAPRVYNPSRIEKVAVYV